MKFSEIYQKYILVINLFKHLINCLPSWDLTLTSNKRRALDMVTKHFGSVAAATIKNTGLEKMPMLALVYKLRGTMEIFQVISGSSTLDELMSQLLSAQDTYASQLAVEVRKGAIFRYYERERIRYKIGIFQFSNFGYYVQLVRTR